MSFILLINFWFYIGIRLVGRHRVCGASHWTPDRRRGVRDRRNHDHGETRYPRLAEDRSIENRQTRRKLYSRRRRHTLGEEQTGVDEKNFYRDADDHHHHHGNRLFWLRTGNPSGEPRRTRRDLQRRRRRHHDIG